eukprot:CAMPEP_0182853338 /NCGR_PEP_ID=MMETSP0034_2-20130328/650_1 /TAXON_ID=156128 /ORGANISM="Nephroselmis pyriformis, Strain CCMP717" /LENGTH=235 /DNA_ID=CAMNT_0024984107 /DNA_START=22 /DNA_END=726 /DNA_ORIENTATION=+
MSWPGVRKVCHARRDYVPLYAKLVEAREAPKGKGRGKAPPAGAPGMPTAPTEDEVARWVARVNSLDRELEEDVIVLFRCLARAQVEQRRSKQAALAQPKVKRGWLWGYYTVPVTPAGGAGPEGEEAAGGEAVFSAGDWEKINELMMAGESGPKRETTPYDVLLEVQAKIELGQVELLGAQLLEAPVASSSLVGLRLGLNMFPKTVRVDVSMEGYGIQTPEGDLLLSGLHAGPQGG